MRIQPLFKKCRLLTLLAVLLVMIGCSGDQLPKRYPVSGVVKFDDGELVKTGVIEFYPEDGEYSANAEIQRDGTFKLRTIQANDGAIPGKYKVIVKQFIVYDKVPKSHHDHGGEVAVKYSDVRTSPLRFDVVAGDNEPEFVVDYRKD